LGGGEVRLQKIEYVKAANLIGCGFFYAHQKYSRPLFDKRGAAFLLPIKK
jgi:hypothetical protein